MRALAMLVLLAGCGPEATTCEIACRAPMVCDPVAGRCVQGTGGGGGMGGSGGVSTGGSGGGGVASGPMFCTADCTSCAAGLTCATYDFPPQKFCQKACTSASQCQAATPGFVGACVDGFCHQECNADTVCGSGMACSAVTYAPRKMCQKSCTNDAGCTGYSPRCVAGVCQADYCDATSCGAGETCAPYNYRTTKTCQTPCASAASCPQATGFSAVCQ